MLSVPSRIQVALLAVTVCAWAGCAAPDASTGGGEDQVAPPSGGVVNVYSARHYDTDDALYTRFTEETGIEINLIEGDSAPLLERLVREGEGGPADVFIAVDAGRLHQAVEQGVLQPTSSDVLSQSIPASLRHPEGLWFGLTKRARVIAVAKDRVAEGAISRYEDLADPQWNGKVLIRSSSNVYNQSLVGSILATAGEEATEAWCQGVVANFARTPQGGDTDQVRALAAGEGDIAVVNTYYLARLAAGSKEDREVFDSVRVIFPNQGAGDRGTHVNVSGAGVVRGAPNQANAVRFLEYLASADSQITFAGGNKEYPVAADYSAVVELAEYGAFREDEINAAIFGGLNQDALMLMDRCGWR